MEVSPATKKQVLDRLGRAVGHLEAVRRMVEDDHDCGEVLTQIAAVRTAVNNAGRILLLDHIEACTRQAAGTGDMAVLEELETLVNRFMK